MAQSWTARIATAPPRPGYARAVLPRRGGLSGGKVRSRVRQANQGRRLVRWLVQALISGCSQGSRESSLRAADIRSAFTIKVRRNRSTGLLTVDLPDENPPIATRRDDFDIHFDIKGTRSR